MTTASITARHKSAAAVTFKDDDTGEVTARFATFDVVDRDGDVMRRSAFTNGQSVPMVWAHDWTKPVGRGVIRLQRDHALFLGSFLPTQAGQEARGAVKAMGELQQWSFGFRVLATQPNAAIKGYDITKLELFEVSPVLVGAGRTTATLAVKTGRTPAPYVPRTALERARLRLALEQLDLERVAMGIRLR